MKAICLLLIVGCGSGLSQADTNSTTDAVRSMVMIDTLCSSDAGCDPARVRALDESVICDSSSVLYRNRKNIPDSGVACPPP
jgi:hypothetical protein